MKLSSLFSSLPNLLSRVIVVAGITLLSSCQQIKPGLGVDRYDCPAHRPHNPGAVSVKVSLSKQMVYVMEGNRPLLVTATCIGLPGKSTPQGNFRAYNRIERKRSGSYGFSVSGGTITPCTAGECKGHYIGFPMPDWVEFAPGYGFHGGFVWPVPRSHGCLRLHKNVCAKFFALVHEGTPINISQSQPEDATLGAKHQHPGPEHYNAPDPAPSISISDAGFATGNGTPLFVD